MKNNRITYLVLLIALLALNSCSKQKTGSEILQQTISSIDAIETIYYKQDMLRSNPRNINDTISRYREMYFKREITDSIVGVKGHWYMYVNDKENVIYEDIYDGSRLLRIRNRDKRTRVYDLVKYPAFKNKHFWSHNTLYGMQYELKHILSNTDSYTIERLNDSLIDSKDTYQIKLTLRDKSTMPGFATKLEDDAGSIYEVLYFIDKKTNYPIKLRGERYSIGNPQQKIFIEQRYYDIKFNLIIDEDVQFNTSYESIKGFKIIEIKPE
jgi:hypothetical protein